MLNDGFSCIRRFAAGVPGFMTFSDMLGKGEQFVINWKCNKLLRRKLCRQGGGGKRKYFPDSIIKNISFRVGVWIA